MILSEALQSFEALRLSSFEHRQECHPPRPVVCSPPLGWVCFIINNIVFLFLLFLLLLIIAQTCRKDLTHGTANSTKYKVSIQYLRVRVRVRVCVCVCVCYSRVTNLVYALFSLVAALNLFFFICLLGFEIFLTLNQQSDICIPLLPPSCPLSRDKQELDLQIQNR